MKIAVIYASVHHHNTAQIVERLMTVLEADFCDVLRGEQLDSEAYDAIVLASGIYYGTMHQALIGRIEAGEFGGKSVALIYTCGLPWINYGKRVGRRLEANGAAYLGSAWCRGHDTYGVLRRFGGIAKGHPDERDKMRVTRQLLEILGMCERSR